MIFFVRVFHFKCLSFEYGNINGINDYVRYAAFTKDYEKQW